MEGPVVDRADLAAAYEVYSRAAKVTCAPVAVAGPKCQVRRSQHRESREAQAPMKGLADELVADPAAKPADSAANPADSAAVSEVETDDSTDWWQMVMPIPPPRQAHGANENQCPGHRGAHPRRRAGFALSQSGARLECRQLNPAVTQTVRDRHQAAPGRQSGGPPPDEAQG